MSKPYRHYAWEMSLYSGKTRAYLRYKAIPFTEKIIRLWDMNTLKQKVGAQVMPVVVTPQGEWLQDTSHILDTLEQRHPQAPVVPQTPRQRLVAYLLEAWGDEFWLPSAMHYRWNFAENFRDLFQYEGGRNLMPFAPRFIRDRLIGTGAAKMRGYLKGLGIVPAQHAQIERWTLQQCDALERHFAQHPYLLGSKPSIGDFGLIAPLYAHLGRDPYPARELMGPRPNLRAWIVRMQHPPQPQGGEYLGGDAIPDTLLPLLDSVFGEFWEQIAATLPELEKATPALQPGRGYARQLGPLQVPMAGAPYRLNARPYSVWMAQRPLDALAALPPEQQATVREWLRGIGGGVVLDTKLPRLKRLTLHVAPE